jgi:transposase-like protein
MLLPGGVPCGSVPTHRAQSVMVHCPSCHTLEHAGGLSLAALPQYGCPDGRCSSRVESV